MSPSTHRSIAIGRSQREFRDDRIFVVATEDTHAPKHYFNFLLVPRVKVLVLETPDGSGKSAPDDVVERLKNAFDQAEARGEVQSGDEFWILIDTDHHIKGTHLKNLLPALRTARLSKFEIAISNPCFEVWLLLHHSDVAPGTTFATCDDVGTQLKRILGSYNKSSVAEGAFPLRHVPLAIQRARELESNPDSPEGYWPETTGTRVYRLLERILSRNRI